VTAAGRVLVVDDDPDMRTLLAEMLDSEGYLVETARDGAEALESVRRGPPAAILLDLMMPVMTGWQFVDCCAADALCEGVPIVVMSAVHDLRSAAEQLHLKGIKAVVPKPFDVEALLDIVARYIPLGQQQSKG
jgi:two-component system response regulator (stage 0 sporulation protein F)